MNLPRRGWWQRLRHGRGFGVHSPFAYRFIREVLRERYAYYSYECIDSFADAWPGGRDSARMLFRVAAFIQPRHVAAGTSELSLIAAEIISMACPRAVVSADVRSDTDFIVLFDEADMVDAAFGCVAGGATAVMPDSRMPAAAALLERLRSTLAYGHCFINGRRTAVFVGRRALPAETFAVRF